MYGIGKVRIHSYEKGLYFRNEEFIGLLKAGTHWFLDPLNRVRVYKSSMRDPWVQHKDLDEIARSGALRDMAEVLDLKDHERALVWIDGRFERILTPGLYALWTKVRKVKVETVDARQVRFAHAELAGILASPGAGEILTSELVPEGSVGLVFFNGELIEELQPGRYAFWKGIGDTKVFAVDKRSLSMDVVGQEILTSDKVTLRLNALITYRVSNPRQAVTAVDDFHQALYRKAQLALRAVIGTRELDTLLSQKEAVASELEEAIRSEAAAFGVEVKNLGIRDIILPGDMKELLNKVTEARKSMEANLITRREETAAMRSQSNTAKLMDSNPTLMRLKELEVLEKIAEKSRLSVVLGEKGLSDRIVNLL